MEHHIARDLLEGYVEDTLEPETKADLARHLEGCHDCRAIIDESERPVDLPAAAPAPEWDEKRLRKTIRRTLFRLVFDALSIWIIGAIVLTLISGYTIQPLLINRGDRTQAAAVATWDLAVLTTPGASIEAWRNDSTLLGRELSVDVARPIGSDTKPLGTYATDLGIWRFRGAEGSPPGRFFVAGTTRTFVPDRVPDDTVVTVDLQWWDNPMTVAEAEALLPTDGEARFLWAGFSVTGAFPDAPDLFPADIDYVLGYHACETNQFLGMEDSSFTSGSSGGAGRVGCFPEQETVSNALAQTRRAVDNLASHRFLVDGISRSATVSLQNIERVAAWLAVQEPAVVSLVVTGPTENVIRLIEAANPDGAIQLDVDFWNWEG